jgi:hypothetical protein
MTKPCSHFHGSSRPNPNLILALTDWYCVIMRQNMSTCLSTETGPPGKGDISHLLGLRPPSADMPSTARPKRYQIQIARPIPPIAAMLFSGKGKRFARNSAAAISPAGIENQTTGTIKRNKMVKRMANPQNTIVGSAPPANSNASGLQYHARSPGT